MRHVDDDTRQDCDTCQLSVEQPPAILAVVNSVAQRSVVPRLLRSIPTGDVVLCLCAVPLVVVAWCVAVAPGHQPGAVLAATAYTVAAGAIAFRRTHLFASFVVTYAAFAVLAFGGATDALGVFPLIVCVPLTICAVTAWAPHRWTGWLATVIACVASPLSPAVSISENRGWSIGAHLSIIGGCYLWSSRRRILAQARARERDHDVEFAQLSERQRIAADLHDGLGHALTAIRAKASTAEATADNHPDRAVEALRVIAELSKESLVDLRRTLGEMSEHSNDDYSHDVGSLRDLLDRARRLDLVLRYKLPAGTDIDKIDSRLSARTRVVVFRAVQEAITNIVRHNCPGVAASISFRIQRPFAKGETLLIRIENAINGPVSASAGGGLGIENMRRRVTDLGGRCLVQRMDDTFVVEIEVPTLKGA